MNGEAPEVAHVDASELKLRLEMAERQRDEALTEAARLRGELEKAIAHLQEIRGTLSWRLMEPLRSLRAWSRR